MDDIEASRVTELLEEEQRDGKTVVFGQGESYEDARSSASENLPENASNVSYFPEDGIETGDEYAVFASYMSEEETEENAERDQRSPGSSAGDYQEGSASFTDSFSK